MTALPDWLPLDAWKGYVEMRAKIRKAMTPRAVELRIKDLAAFHAEGHDLVAILDQSTANNWTDLYPPKDKERRSEARSKLPQLGKHGQATAENAQAWVAQSGLDDSIEEKKRFATLLTHMSDYYKSEISRAVLGIYWNGLRQYSYEAIEKACWAHTQLPDEAGRWMPRNSDIIKMIEGGTADQSQVAWSKVETAIRVRGSWDDLIFDDALIHRVVQDMGGWVKLAGMPDEKDLHFAGKEFQTRYRAFRMRGETPEYPSHLIGVANAHNASNGQPRLPPILVGEQEKAKQVFKRGSGATLLGMQHINETIQLANNHNKGAPE